MSAKDNRHLRGAGNKSSTNTHTMAVLRRRFSKVFKLTLLFCLIAVGLIFFHLGQYSDAVPTQYKDYLKSYITSNSTSSVSAEHDIEQENSSSYNDNNIKSFFDTVFQHILDYSPTGKSERIYNKEKCLLNSVVGYSPDNYKDWYKLSYENLGNCLEISDDEYTNLQSNHASFIEEMDKLTLPNDIYQGDGIVLVAGGKFSLLSYLVVKTIRKFGTTLPVEVFIPPDEVEELSLIHI